MDIRLLVVAYLMICTLTVIASPYRSRSRNKNSSPTYDQKQTGEYNIQLHLKDFEVVALLSDGAFGELGDYDYNYDYSELTVKPGGSHSTTQPSTSKKPSQKPETILPATLPTSTTPAPSEIIQLIISSTTPPPQTTKIILSEAPTTQSQPQISIVATPEKDATIAILPTNLPMRLENELEINSNSTLIIEDDTSKQSTIKAELYVKPMENITVADNKEPSGQEEILPLVVHRKCASGFTRDKLGRCRRVRRPPPQFSFGISRLASLASKLRQGANDSSQMQTNNETENLEE